MDYEMTKAWQAILRREGAGFSSVELEAMIVSLQQWVANRKFTLRLCRICVYRSGFRSNEWLGDVSWEADSVTDLKKYVANHIKKNTPARLDADCVNLERFAVNHPDYQITEVDINGDFCSETVYSTYVPKAGDEIKVYLRVPDRND